MAQTLIETPIGPITVQTTDLGLSRVWFGDLREAELQVSVRSKGHLRDAVMQLSEYFDRRRDSFDLELDRRDRHGFRGEVLDALERVPFGETVTYGQLATRAGRPRAARAVGTTMATNPIAIVVPCHRVVPSDGGAGRFGGGTPAKEWLLRREGVLG